MMAHGLLVLLMTACSPSSTWVTLGEGVERQESNSDGVVVIAHRVSLATFEPQVVSFTTATRVPDAAPPHDHIAINASFFDDHQRAMGIVVSNGVVQGKALSKWASLRVDDRGPRVLAPGVSDVSATTTMMVQGIPRMVVEGGVVAGLVAQTAVRSAVCVTPTTMTIVITTAAIEATRFATHLRDVVRCRDALNLDGGPSTQLSVRMGDHLEQRSGGWGVPNMLVLSRRH
jgi:hypothetical protein